MELEGCDLSGSGKEESIPARVSQRLVHRVGCWLVQGSARRVTLRSSGFQRRLWFGDIGSVPKKDNLEVLDSFKCVWLEEASLYCVKWYGQIPHRPHTHIAKIGM